MAAGQSQKTGVGQGLGQIAQVEIGLAVALAREGQHRVGAALHRAVDHAGEVDAQEGKLRIGHRVDQRAAQVVHLRLERIILAAEWDDGRRRFAAIQRRDAVGVEPGAVDHDPRLQLDGGAAHPHRARAFVQSLDADAGQDLAAAGLQALGQARADLLEIDDARVVHHDSRDAGRVRFDLAQPFGAHQLAGHTVGHAAPVEVVQPAQLGFVQRHDHLAAQLVGDPFFPAEGDHSLPAGPAGGCLQRTGLVIDARVQHPRVVPCLVLRQPGLLFHDGDAPVRKAAAQLKSGGQPDNATADDSYIKIMHVSPVTALPTPARIPQTSRAPCAPRRTGRRGPGVQPPCTSARRRQDATIASGIYLAPPSSKRSSRR